MKPHKMFFDEQYSQHYYRKNSVMEVFFEFDKEEFELDSLIGFILQKIWVTNGMFKFNQGKWVIKK